MSCGEVGDIQGISKSNNSYHLRTLRETKLIRVRKLAQTRYMSIEIETFETYLPEFLDTLQKEILFLFSSSKMFELLNK